MEIEDAEIVSEAQSPIVTPEEVSTPPVEAPEATQTEATAPVINGQTVEKVKYLDYENIRVVFDANSGAVLGVMPAKKVKIKK
jgi:hypothetical protein